MGMCKRKGKKKPQGCTGYASMLCVVTIQSANVSKNFFFFNMKNTGQLGY